MIAYVDGAWSASEDARISVLDHGLLYGDGVFEGIRFYARKAFLLEAHLTRLEASARALALDLPMAREETATVVQEAIDRTGLADGYIRLIVTRGVGALGVSPHTCPRASLIVIAAPLSLYPPERYRDGVKLVTSSLRRSAHDALPPQVKSLNYLTSVLASIEARRQGADEAILLNAQGLIAECTADNLFLVSGGRAGVDMHGQTDRDGEQIAHGLPLLGLGVRTKTVAGLHFNWMRRAEQTDVSRKIEAR